MPVTPIGPSLRPQFSSRSPNRISADSGPYHLIDSIFDLVVDMRFRVFFKSTCLMNKQLLLDSFLREIQAVGASLLVRIFTV